MINDQYLYELNSKFGAGKNIDQGHYLEQYHKLFEKRRLFVKNVLEIGVASGGSVRMLEEYFPNAIIHAIDVDETCRVNHLGRVQIHIGSQSDLKFLEEEIIPQGPFEIIIDDGSHDPLDQKTTLMTLWDSLLPGGIYSIEDTCFAWSQIGPFLLHQPKGLFGEEVSSVVSSVATAEHTFEDISFLPFLDSIWFGHQLCLLTKKLKSCVF